MSLINDALKKAQKQRTGEAPSLHSMPSVGGESPQRIARRAKPAGFNTLILRAGIAGAMALVLAVGAYFAMRGKPETGNLKAEPKASAQGGTPVAGGPSAPPEQPAANRPSPAPAAPVFTVKTDPVAPRPETGAAVATATVPETVKPEGPKFAAKQPTASNAQPAPVSQVSTPAAPAPKMEPRAIQYIENLKIAGVRVSTTDAKVLMNDRVYRIGGTVEAEMGIKLVEIAPGALTFEDERGGRYTRNF